MSGSNHLHSLNKTRSLSPDDMMDSKVEGTKPDGVAGSDALSADTELTGAGEGLPKAQAPGFNPDFGAPSLVAYKPVPEALDLTADSQSGYPDFGAPSVVLNKPADVTASPAPAPAPTELTSTLTLQPVTAAPAALSYSLGADDISKIVDAILPNLAPFLPNLTNDKQYVLLHKLVLGLSKGKTFTNKHDLDALVKDIVKQVSDFILKAASNNSSTVLPNYICGATCGR